MPGQYLRELVVMRASQPCFGTETETVGLPHALQGPRAADRVAGSFVATGCSTPTPDNLGRGDEAESHVRFVCS